MGRSLFKHTLENNYWLPTKCLAPALKMKDIVLVLQELVSNWGGRCERWPSQQSYTTWFGSRGSGNVPAESYQVWEEQLFLLGTEEWVGVSILQLEVNTFAMRSIICKGKYWSWGGDGNLCRVLLEFFPQCPLIPLCFALQYYLSS